MNCIVRINHSRMYISKCTYQVKIKRGLKLQEQEALSGATFDGVIKAIFICYLNFCNFPYENIYACFRTMLWSWAWRTHFFPPWRSQKTHLFSSLHLSKMRASVHWPPYSPDLSPGTTVSGGRQWLVSWGLSPPLWRSWRGRWGTSPGTSTLTRPGGWQGTASTELSCACLWVGPLRASDQEEVLNYQMSKYVFSHYNYSDEENYK